MKLIIQIALGIVLGFVLLSLVFAFLGALASSGPGDQSVGFRIGFVIGRVLRDYTPLVIAGAVIVPVLSFVAYRAFRGGSEV